MAVYKIVASRVNNIDAEDFVGNWNKLFFDTDGILYQSDGSTPGGTRLTPFSFKTITVSGQSNIVADSASDTLTMVAGTNITLTTSGDTVTINSTASGSGSGDIESVVAGAGLTGGATSGDATINVVGGTGITANANDIAIDSTVTTLTGSQTLTNKTLTSPVINTGVSGTAVLDEDDLSSNSATKLATQQSIKAYVDANAGGVTLTGTQTLTNKTLTAPVLSGSASAAGSILFKEDTDNGTNAVTLIGPASTADVTITLPASADTLVGKATTDTLSNKTLASPTMTGSLTVGSAVISEADLEQIDDLTAGTVVASKAVVVDSNKDVGTIRNLTIDGTFSDGNYTFDTSGNVTGLGTIGSGAITSTGVITGTGFTIGSAVINEAELETIDGITAGTVVASKAVIVDSNKDIGTFRNVTIDGTFSDGNYTFDTSGNVSGLGTVGSGAITSSGNITSGGSFIIGSASITEAELETIDGVTAGTVAASKAVVVDSNKDAASFRNLTASGTVTFGSLADGSITATAFVDEDDMSSDSATLIPTQQSVKAYVDANANSGDITSVVAGDGLTGGATSGAATVNVVGGTGITANSNDIAIDSTVTTLTGTQTLTNKTLTAPVLSGSASAAGSILFKEDTDNGTNAVTLIGPAATADVTITLPASADTLVGKATTDTLSNKTLASPTMTGSLTVGSAVISEADLEQIDDLTAGTAVASKALVVDSNKDIGTLRNLTIDGTFSDGNYTFDTSGNVTGLGTIGSGAITSTGVVTGTGFTIGSAVINEAELETIDGVTAGTVAASKAVVVDSNLDIGTFRNLTINGTFSDGNYTFDTSGNVTGLGTIGSGNITSSGTVQGTTITATTAFVPDAQDGAAIGTSSLQFSDLFLADEAVVSFGDDNEITLTHVADVGLTLTHTAAGDNKPIILNLKSEEDDITVGEVIGTINFTAGDSGGTDAIATAAGIEAVAEDTFAADNNATKLSFKTAVSEAATEKMSLSSAGLLTVVDDIVIKSGGTIGGANDKDLLTLGNAELTVGGTVGSGAITSTGVVTGTGFTIGSAVINEADLEQIDDLTAGTVAASKAVVVDSNKDIGTFRNLTINGTFSDGNYTFDTSGNVTGLGTVGCGAVTSSGVVTGTGFTIGSAVINEAELETIDGITAGTVAASKAVVVDSNKDIGTFRNLTIDGTFSDGNYTFDTSGNVTGLGTIGSGAITSTGVVTGTTVEATGDTSAGDNAAMGYTSAEGLILTGQGSTSDITVKNDADGTVFTVPTGTDDILFPDNAKAMWGASSDMTLYHDATNSYITNAVGALKIATETSGIAVTIGHSTSEVTVADNLTVAGNLTVSGTQTVVDTVTMNAQNAVIFEGATADDFETTLTITDPTADRTITLPNVTGTVSIIDNTETLSNKTLASPTMTGSLTVGSAVISESDIEQIDDLTAGTVVANKAVVVDGNKDVGTIRNLTIDGTFSDGNYTFDTSGNVTGLGTVGSGAITSSGVVTGTGFTIGSAAINEAELETIDGVTAGTVAASKAVVVDSNKDIGTFRNVTIDGTFSDGNYTFDTSGNVTGLGTIGSGNITSSGTIQGTTITATTAFVPDAQDGAALGTSSLQFSDLFLADGAVISFGDDNEITLTHSADDGLLLKHVGTGDGKEPSLTFQAGDDDIAVDDVLGSIFFQAPGEGAGSDAIAIAAGIEAVSEGNFAADNNATKLSFKTAVSEAATEKMSLSSAGLLTVVDDIVIKSGGTVGGANDPDLLTLSNGALTVAGTIACNTSLTIGSAAMSEADLEQLDGITAGTAAASKALVLDSNLDIGTLRNLTINGTFSDGNYTFDTSGNVTGLGTVGCGAVTSTGVVTGTGFTIGSAVINEAELETIDGITAGTVAASKAVVVDSNLDIGTFRNLTINGTFSDGNYTFDTSGNVTGLGTVGCGAVTSSGVVTGTGFTIGSAVINEAELETIDGVTAGTVAASKAVVVDSNLDIGTFRNLTINGTFSDGNYTFDTSGNVTGLGTIGSGNITSSGTVQGTTITATTAFVPDAQDGAALGTSSLQFSDLFLADEAVVSFGDDNEITLTHVPDVGVTLTHTAAGDNTPIILNLKSEEDDIIADEVIGTLNFTAGDSGGTDAILVAAGIEAVAEGTFAADNNATKLSFKTAASEAAAEKMSLSSGGNLTVAGNITLSGTDLIFEGATDDDFETTLRAIDPTADRTVTLPNVTGTVSIINNTETLTNKTLTTPVINTLTAGTFEVDASVDIILDAGGADIKLKDDGTHFGRLSNVGGELVIASGSSITTALTFSGANITAAGTIGSGAITSTGVVTGTGFTIGSAAINEAELETIDGVTAGTVAASKAVVVDSNKDISSFRNLTASGTVTFGSLADGTITATAFVDEDDMSSDSATLIPTQQSVKAYVDSQASGVTLTGTQTLTNKTLTAPVLSGSASAAGSILFKEDTDNGTNAVTLIGPASTGDVTLTLPAATDTLVGKATTDTLTNKTIASPTMTGSLTVGSAVISEADLEQIDDLTAGTAVASKALVVDSNKDIGTIRNLTIDGTFSDGNYTFDTSGNVTGLGTIGSGAITSTGVVIGTTVEPSGDTSAGDNAAIGYTSAEGLILTGQGSTSDVTLKNDADGTVFTVPTGTDDILFPDNAKAMWGASSDMTLYHDASNSYITNAVGALKIATETSGIAVTIGHTTSVVTIADNCTVTDTLTFGSLSDGSITATAFVDEDDMSSDSATLIPTQQSVKAYVDNEVGSAGGGDITAVTAGDGLTGGATTGAATLNVVGGTGITANANDIAIDSTVTTLTGSQTLTNKTLTSPVINTATFGTSILPTSADGTTLGSASKEFSDLFLADEAVVSFGNDQEITLTHVQDVGLTLTHTAAGDNTPIILNLKSEEDAIIADEVIGTINFTAGDSGGTDAILTAAGISAIAEDTFAADNNATKLSFKTAASEAAAEKMFLSSAGNLDVTGDITGATLNADGDTSAGDNAAIGYTSGEGLILTGQGSTSDITVKNDADGTVFTVPTGTDDILFPDDAKAMWGDGSDLQIHHGGTHSMIKNQTGDLRIKSNSLLLKNQADNATYLDANNGGSVDLYHNNSKKFETDSGGITVTGSITIGSAAISEADLEQIDDLTAGTVVASKAVVVDSNKDVGTIRNLTIDGTFSDGNYTFDTSGNVTGLGTIGSGAITSTGVVVGTTVEPSGDTSAGDNAAIGYTSGEGLILTGQGSTSDVTLKNDADGTVFTVPTGTDDILFPDNAKAMWGASSDMTLYHDATNSYITNAVGALKIATETSGIAVTIGHSTSEVTIADNLTVTGDLTVSGTQTVVDTVTMNAQNAVIFEGATADSHETTLTITDPTQDRTITLPNVTGTLSVLDNTETLSNKTLASPTMTGSLTVGSAVISEADLEQIDDLTAGTVVASKAVVVDSNKDVGTIRNLTIDGTFSDGNYTFDTSGNVSGLGTVGSGAITSSGVVIGTTVEPSGDTSSGDNAAIGYTSAEGLILTGQGSTSDITLKNDADGTVFTVPTGTDDILFPDSAKILLGDGSDIELYHGGTHSFLKNSTGDFRIRSNSMLLKNQADNATYIDMNNGGSVDLYHNNSKKLETDSGGITVTGSVTIGSAAMSEADLEQLDGITAGTAAASKALVLDSNLDIGTLRNLTINGTFSDGNYTFDTSGNVTGLGTIGSGNITSSGTVQGTTITATTAFAPDAQDGAALGTSSLQFSDLFLADEAVVSFGDDNEITLTHVADVGLTLTHTATGDNTPIILNLKSEEDAIIADEVIGTLNFTAGDSGGTDAILTAAGIEAVAEDTFAADNNATKLSFKTAASEAATEKMALSSGGNLTLAGDLYTDKIRRKSDSSTTTKILLNDEVIKLYAGHSSNQVVNIESGAVTVTGTLACDTSLTIGSAAMSEADLEQLDGITAGTAAASKALVLDSNKDIGTIRNLTIDGTFSDGNYTFDTSGNVTGLGTVGCGAVTSTGVVTGTGFTIGSAVINEAELEQIDGITAGTVAASKAVVVDSNKDIGTFRNVTIDGTFSDGNYTFDTSGNVTGLGTIGSGAITSTGVVIGTTVEPSGDTSAGDNAAIGYTSAEGLILTGQGSTSDITVKNDADGTVFTVPTGTDDILFPDNAGAIWGDGSDLKIYHGGSNSIIQEGGAGGLIIRASTLTLLANNTSENFVVCTENGAVDIYHDGNKKLETDSGGITVTGSITIGSAAISEADLEQIDDLTAGTVVASKAVVVDSNKDVGTIRNLTIDGTFSDGNYTFDTSGNVSGLGTVGSGAITSSGVVIGTTVEPSGDTSAGDNAAIGYTSGEGLILTGQGSTSDVTLKNDADGTVFTVPTGTDDILFPDSAKAMWGASSDMTLYHDATNSYITNAVGALKIATETSGIAVTIGHTTSVVTIADNCTVTDTLTFGSLGDGTITVTAFVDEDNMSSNSATLIPTQQSVKAYVDSTATGKQGYNNSGKHGQWVDGTDNYDLSQSESGLTSTADLVDAFGITTSNFLDQIDPVGSTDTVDCGTGESNVA